MNGNSNGSGGGRFAKRPFNTTSNSNPNPEETIKSRVGNGWQSRIKDNGTTSKSSTNSRFDPNPTTSRNRTDGSTSNPSSRNPLIINGKAKIINNKSYGLGLEISPPIAGLESESDTETSDSERGHQEEEEEEEEGPPPSVPVKPYPPRLTLTSNSFKGSSKFNLGSGDSSKNGSGGSLLSPLRTGFELQEDDNINDQDQPSTSKSSFSNGSTSPIKSSSSNNGKSSTTKIPRRPPSPEISSPESSFSKRRTAYRSGNTDGGTTDGEGYADEVEIATASVNTVRRVGVGSGPTTSSSSTSNISSTTPNKLKKFTSSTSPSNQHQILPKILASSPSGSYRPLEPIPSSTSLSNLGDDSFPPPNSSPSSTRKISSSAQDSDEDEGINQSKTVSRFTSNKSKSRSSNSRKVSSSISSPMDQNRDENFTSSKDSNPTNQTYDTSTDGSTTTTTVLASIFDESDNNDEEDSSPRETLMIPSSRNSLLRQLAAEQARVEVNTFQYQILSSNELEEYQNELKQLERRSKDVRHKLIVRTRIRDAAVKLRRAHRRTPSQSAANGSSVDRDPSSSSNFRERRNPSISTSGGKSIEDALPQIPPSPAYSTINGLPSPGFGPPPGTPSLGRNRSATFTNVGQAEVEAEASATAASANVDAVAEELLSISERTSELRKKVVEHQAAILAFRVDSLEKERLQESKLKSNKISGSTSELKNKFKEREKTLIDQINQDRNQLNKIKETERNRREEINELKFRLEDALKERKLDEVRNRKLREELEESQRNGSGKIDDEEFKTVEEALNRSRLELKTSKDNERNVSRQKDDLERKVSELERILAGERRSGQDSRHETSRNLTQLQQDLESHKSQLDSSRKQVSESERKFKELETSHSKDQKLFQERAQLFFAFERNLNDTEERLKEEEKILAQMLGKVDGREEMDDLLSMIKSGGNSSIKKDRLAGQGIQDLLRNVSEHISDLGQELNRLGGLNEKRRTRPSYDEEEEDDVSDDDQDLNRNRSIRNQFKDSESTKVDSQLILELEKSKKQLEDSAREREDRLKLEIENLKKESQNKEKENLKALQESKDQLEKLKVEAEKSKKEAAEKSKATNTSSSPFKTPSPLRSGRDFKDIARITELEKEVEKLKLTNKISSKSSTTSISAGTTSSRGISQDNEASEELLEARKVLKELSLMLPPSETLTKINHQVSSSSSTSSPSPPSILDSQLSALALVLQPGGSKALPSLPSNNSEMDYGSSSNNTTAISSSSSTSFTTTSQNHESEYESLPERLRVTLMTARSAALLARDVDANNQRMGKDTAEVVMERETLRAQQEEEHQKLIDRTQTRVKGLESTVKELREALECAHSDLRSLESGSSSRPQTLRSASAGTNGFGKIGPSPTRYNHRAHISPQPIMIPPNSNSLTPNKIPGGNSWRSQSPGQLSPTSNALPLLTPSPRKNTFNLPMLSSSPTPSVASNSSSSHQPRTITLGMDTNQLLSKVRELERELDGNKVWKRKGERVDQLERILDETQAQLESSKNELMELKENHEKQKAQFLSEINSLNDELHGAREMLRNL